MVQSLVKDLTNSKNCNNIFSLFVQLRLVFTSDKLMPIRGSKISEFPGVSVFSVEAYIGLPRTAHLMELVSSTHHV